MKAIDLLLAFALTAGCARATPPPRLASDAAIIAATVDPLVEAEMRRSGMPGAAFVFVRGGRIVYQRGYGVSDLASASPADSDRTVWPIASITKVATAVAAMQLVAEGRIRLDEDVNRRLERLQVPTQGYPPLTLRHLLSHTGGLDELPGRQFEGAEPPDMAEFLRSRIVRYRAPGRSTAYSTYGIWIAGLLVEDVSGEAYAEHVRRRVFAPAGMTSARILTRRGDEGGVATPYALEDGQARPIPHEFYVSRPASSAVASAADMGRLAIALLGGRRGGGGGRAILPARWRRAMFAQSATVHSALPGWGLGFQLDRVNGKAIAEHGGDIGGFSALLVLLPEEDAGFFIVTHGEGNDLRFQLKRALMDRLWPAAPMAVPTPNPADAPRLAEYAGRYFNTLACRSCPGSEEQAFELTANADGTISLWGQRWVPVERDLFVREDGRRLLGFSRDAQGQIASVSGGSWRVGDRLYQ